MKNIFALCQIGFKERYKFIYIHLGGCWHCAGCYSGIKIIEWYRLPQIVRVFFAFHYEVKTDKWDIAALEIIQGHIRCGAACDEKILHCYDPLGKNQSYP